MYVCSRYTCYARYRRYIRHTRHTRHTLHAHLYAVYVTHVAHVSHAHLHDKLVLDVPKVPDVPQEALVAPQRHLGLQHRAHVRHQSVTCARVHQMKRLVEVLA